MINTTECLEVFGSVEEFPFVVAVAFVVIAVMRQLMRFDTVTPHKNLYTTCSIFETVYIGKISWTLPHTRFHKTEPQVRSIEKL